MRSVSVPDQLYVKPFEELATASDQVVSGLGIAVMNLSAARGLPGTDSLDVFTCLDKLDSWAARVRLETARHIYRFDPQSQQPPSEFAYGNSFARFLCYFLLQVLQEDCGVRYNPARKFQPDFCQPADLFIHGIVADDGAGGTCASMPVVYVAVGSRLGYPLKLVEGRKHLFFRWEDPKGTLIRWPNLGECWVPPDRFNVEGAGEGISYRHDSYYLHWPSAWTKADFHHGRYLQSLTAKEELALFLIQRGECFWDLGQGDEALKAYYFARKLAPNDIRYEWLHAQRTREYDVRTADDLARVIEINQRNQQRRLGQQPPMGFPSRPVKLAYGTPRPLHLPPSTPVQYVSPGQADPLRAVANSWTGSAYVGPLLPLVPAFPKDPLAMLYSIREQNTRLILQHPQEHALFLRQGQFPRPDERR